MVRRARVSTTSPGVGEEARQASDGDPERDGEHEQDRDGIPAVTAPSTDLPSSDPFASDVPIDWIGLGNGSESVRPPPRHSGPVPKRAPRAPRSAPEERPDFVTFYGGARPSVPLRPILPTGLHDVPNVPRPSAQSLEDTAIVVLPRQPVRLWLAGAALAAFAVLFGICVAILASRWTASPAALQASPSEVELQPASGAPTTVDRAPEAPRPVAPTPPSSEPARPMSTTVNGPPRPHPSPPPSVPPAPRQDFVREL